MPLATYLFDEEQPIAGEIGDAIGAQLGVRRIVTIVLVVPPYRTEFGLIDTVKMVEACGVKECGRRIRTNWRLRRSAR